MLALAVGFAFVAFGVSAGELQPSLARLAVTALTALLAPLFWPGCATTTKRTAGRVLWWSALATCVAALLLLAAAPAPQPPARVAAACLMLLPILLLSHAAAAALEAHWNAAPAAAPAARAISGPVVVLTLGLAGGLPLWAGPLAERLMPQLPGGVDALLAASPLAHLALASGNDLLRNQWLYERSNLALLRFEYPTLADVAGAYAAACVLMALAAVTLLRRRRLASSSNT